MPLIQSNAVGGIKSAGYWWRRLLATGLLAMGWPQGALFFYMQMLRLIPHELHASGSAAHVLAQLGRRAEAIHLLETAVAVHPGDAASWFNLAYLLEAQGRTQDSEPAFRAALALEPDMDRAWYGLAILLMREDRLAEAVLALEETTRLQPLSPYGWYQLAKVHVRGGQEQLALKVIRHLRGFEPRVAARLAEETGLTAALAGRP